MNPGVNAPNSGNNPAGALWTYTRCYAEALLPVSVPKYQGKYCSWRIIMRSASLWNHRFVHAPTFRPELLKALESSDHPMLNQLNLRWCTHLFFIMCAILI